MLENIAVIFQIMTATAAVSVEIIVYRWSKKTEIYKQNLAINDQFQELNALTLQNTELLEIDAMIHPYGNLNIESVRKIYLYFIWLNIADNILTELDQDLISSDIGNSRLQNTSKILHQDQKFIEEHVFPRGYPERAQNKLRENWLEFGTQKNQTSPNNLDSSALAATISCKTD